jgi:hypothetical protein
MIDCIIIGLAIVMPIKELSMDISNIKKVNLYEVPYGDKVILLSHEEFERYGVGGKDDLIANAKRPKRYYEVTIDGIVYTVPEEKFDEFMKSKIQ